MPFGLYTVTREMSSSDSLLEVKGLMKHYPVFSRGVLFRKQVGIVHAVDDVSFSLAKQETLGLVGESGCGKTTTAKVILQLEPPTSGEVLFEGESVRGVLSSKNAKKILALRRNMQLIFQNPYASLDPMMTVSDILREPLMTHNIVPKAEQDERVYELLRMVGLEEYHAERYPHEFSGGQRQRICIARALSVDPKFVIADEPVSSLDVSIRAQILNLLVDLQDRLGIAYLYISHDLSSVRQISHRVAVMYLGKIVELADTDSLFRKPLHRYTTALMSAVPIPDPETKARRIVLPGEVPSPVNPPSGCRFHPRCGYATERCRTEIPELMDVGGGHLVACHLA
jgi:oligopeptide/dipeptide ABC transporter ATP-binding protein